MLTYASLEPGRESAPGQFTSSELQDLYAIDGIHSGTALYGVIGYPLGHSLSPHIHNPVFAQLGLDGRYLPIPVKSAAELAPHLCRFAGLSVTIPHKVEILKYVDEMDISVREVTAANTLVWRGRRLVAYNTDIFGIEAALQETLSRGIKTAVLLGTGGAARAAAAVLRRAGCRVAVLSRDPQKAQQFAAEFGFAADELANVRQHPGDLLVNATPVGMAPQMDQSPLPADALAYDVVFDMVYNPLETRLLREARRQGARVIPGLEMFIAQAARQFELWTGHVPPMAVMRERALRQLYS
jgi:shikimate dehydrogenase